MAKVRSSLFLSYSSPSHNPLYNYQSNNVTLHYNQSTMSIYANSSDSYWKERQKKSNASRSSLVIAGMVIFAIVAGAILHNKHSSSTSSSTNQILTQRRAMDQTTDIHWKQCESRVNSQQECTTICQPERNSIHRKTMHQACLHGCQQAHVSSTAMSCRGKVSSEEEVFQEIGGLAYVHCSKFQSIDPKPDVFATCRKYHRAGTKNGFRMGIKTMRDVLDEEWADILSNGNNDSGSLSAEQ